MDMCYKSSIITRILFLNFLKIVNASFLLAAIQLEPRMIFGTQGVL